MTGPFLQSALATFHSSEGVVTILGSFGRLAQCQDPSGGALATSGTWCLYRTFISTSGEFSQMKSLFLLMTTLFFCAYFISCFASMIPTIYKWLTDTTIDVCWRRTFLHSFCLEKVPIKYFLLKFTFAFLQFLGIFNLQFWFKTV